LVGCGGGGSSSGGGNNNGGGGSVVKPVSISIRADKTNAEPGWTVSLTVTTQNTEIVWPSSSDVAGNYTPSGNVATWTLPEIAGSYDFTVKAAADTTKKATVTVTVTVAESKPESVDVSTAKNTFAEDVNTAGQVSGYYEDAAGKAHGFKKTGADYEEINNCAGAVDVWAEGINASGTVVGTFKDADGLLHGFTYASHACTPLDYPETDETQVWDINDAGTVAGYFWDADLERYRGFTRAAGTGAIFEKFDYPSTAHTFVIGLNDRGAVVGYYVDIDGWYHGFVKDAGGYREIIPQGAEETELLGINNAGQMVGLYWDSEGWEHNFVLDGGELEEVMHPDAAWTWLTRIADDGRVSGYYEDAAGKYHGFTW
jgi:probable HAF family extracellular repeat protein